MTSFQILEKNNYDYSLVEAYACKSKDELHARERFYIEKNECVNKIVPTRSRKEYYTSHKDEKKTYDVLNKDRIKENHTIWRNANKEYLQHKRRIWAEENVEHLKQYKEETKEHRNEMKRNLRRQKEQTICECGGHYKPENKNRHNKSKLHNDFKHSK
jgi:hypothetical protein